MRAEGLSPSGCWDIGLQGLTNCKTTDVKARPQSLIQPYTRITSRRRTITLAAYWPASFRGSAIFNHPGATVLPGGRHGRLFTLRTFPALMRWACESTLIGDSNWSLRKRNRSLDGSRS